MTPADPVGLVLAGGESSRMGRDKALLSYAGVPQWQRSAALLGRHCHRVVVSVGSGKPPWSLPESVELLPDDSGNGGPAAGLATAARSLPGQALLVLAVDLPLVDDAMLSSLVAARGGGALATAFRHPDGTIEPLCTLWEPAALELVVAAATDRTPSLRRILEGIPLAFAPLSQPEKLCSVDTPAQYAAARQMLERGSG